MIDSASFFCFRHHNTSPPQNSTLFWILVILGIGEENTLRNFEKTDRCGLFRFLVNEKYPCKDGSETLRLIGGSKGHRRAVGVKNRGRQKGACGWNLGLLIPGDLEDRPGPGPDI